MFSAAPPAWGVLLPGRGAVRVLVDAAFTDHLDVVADLAVALGWLVALAAVTAAVFHRIAAPRRA